MGKKQGPTTPREKELSDTFGKEWEKTGQNIFLTPLFGKDGEVLWIGGKMAKRPSKPPAQPWPKYQPDYSEQPLIGQGDLQADASALPPPQGLRSGKELCDSVYEAHHAYQGVTGDSAVPDVSLDPMHPVATIDDIFQPAEGVTHVRELCSKCGRWFDNPFSSDGTGDEGVLVHGNTGKPVCLNCISLDCIQCGKNVPGRMIPIPGSLYTRCPYCTPPKPHAVKYMGEM